MAKKQKKISKNISTSYEVHLDSYSLVDSKEVEVKQGSKSLGKFKRNYHYTSDLVYTSTSGQNMRLLPGESDDSSAKMFLRGTFNGSHNGEISLVKKEKISGDEKVIS